MRRRAPASPGEVRIPNRATYWPVAPIDLVIGAPIVARLLLGATPIGGLVQGAALGAYAASAIRDWRSRQAIERIDFRRDFGADLDRLVPMPREAREAEVRALAERLSDEFIAERLPRREAAVEVDRHLTSYIAGITGQRVRTSVELRTFALARLAFPFALGVCDPLSGDVAIFKDTGVFEPHVIAHEFCHRKGYWKELHAQVLAYFSLTASGHPVLQQSAGVERLYRSLRVLSGDDDAEFSRLALRAPLRRELRLALLPPRSTGGRAGRALRRLYDGRMRLTGQNGVSDYDVGFTNFLYTVETGGGSTGARGAHTPHAPR